jgi:hypothetical protein
LSCNSVWDEWIFVFKQFEHALSETKRIVGLRMYILLYQQMLY